MCLQPTDLILVKESCLMEKGEKGERGERGREGTDICHAKCRRNVQLRVGSQCSSSSSRAREESGHRRGDSKVAVNCQSRRGSACKRAV